MSTGRVIVSGTGRAGTTLLMAMLTDLGCDTGFRQGIQPDTSAGGLERNIERSTARFVKAPALSRRLRPLLESGTVTVDHVIVPVRELEVAAASRVRAAGYGRRLDARGGLTGTRRASKQRDVLAHLMYELVYTMTVFDLPHTFLEFPRFTHDWEYMHAKLGFLTPDKTVDDYRRVIEARYDASAINEQPLDRNERLRATLLVPWRYAGIAMRRLTGRGAPSQSRESKN